MGTVAAAPPIAPVAGSRMYRAGALERVAWLCVSVACFGVLAIGAALKPSATGAGTHKQLGLSECGWVLAFNKPCFTCGMTTAFSQAAHGRLDKSFAAQPAGALLAIAAAVMGWIGVYVAWTGSAIGRRLDVLLAPRLLWWYGGVVAGAWAYKLWTWPG